jgi:hypothetical protein
VKITDSKVSKDLDFDDESDFGVNESRDDDSVNREIYRERSEGQLQQNKQPANGVKSASLNYDKN